MITINMPAQRKSFTAKTKKWRTDCVKAIDEGVSYLNSNEVRRSVMEKTIDGELYDGILNMGDVMKVISSANTLRAYVPKNIQHRPILRPKIELLVGEASKEPFDWSVMVTDPNSISQKQEAKKKAINEKMQAILESEETDPEVLKAKLEDMALYFKYSWKDAKEVRGIKILKYYVEKLHLDELHTENMVDRLVYGEEVLMFDIVGREPAVFKIDPKKLHTVYASNSNKISDADIIVIEEYWSVGKIIDTYYDVLTPTEIDRLNAKQFGAEDNGDGITSSFMINEAIMIDNMLTTAEGANNSQNYGAVIDTNGNVRHLKALWRSQKLVKVVKGIDPQTGESYEKVVSEEYVANTYLGETIEKIWVEEWWQGTKIANDIFKKMEPRAIQFNTEANISKSHPGIAGRMNSISGGKVVSFLSKMKPYQYLYDITWDRLLDDLKKNMGAIVEMDLAKKPAKWTTEKWLHYAYKGGILFVDSFKEATKGAATGKLAGHFNTTGKVINTDTGDAIQQKINLLEYIKSEMSEIVGITPQRQGAVSTSATVGGTERAVMASNNNTAYEFYQHHQFKIESLQILLETAKVALRNNKKIAQNILDDFSLEIFEVDGDEFIDTDLSVFATTSKQSQYLQRNLEMYTQAYMQNGGDFSTVLDILFSDSISEKRRKIELAEQKAKEARSQSEQQKAKIAQQQLAQNAADKEAERDLEFYKIDANNATKLLIEEMKAESKGDEIELQSEISAKDAMLRIKEMQAKIAGEKVKK